MGRFLVLCSLLIATGAHAQKKVEIPHWDPEMTGPEYYEIIKNHPELLATDTDEDLKKIMEKGKRLLDWLSHINQNRPPEKKIALTSPETQMAYPITAPGFSNPTLINERFDKLKAEAPTWFTDVVVGGKPFTNDPPTTEAEFIKWGWTLERIYQSCSRWLLQQPYLSAYAGRKRQDLRGYYYLSQEPNLKATLEGLGALGEEKKAQYVSWLTGLCFNSALSESSCKKEVTSQITAGTSLYPFYEKYVGAAKRMWDGFFNIGAKRDDVEWTSANPNVMNVPFVDPGKSEIRDWLTENIHDEWRFDAWKLTIDFDKGNESSAYIEFEPGATAHVEYLAGNQIVMDANRSLSEYDMRWTIRHEYGHVLGLPDCYIEFYDESSSTMINYQLDITNLMCSRRGHIKQSHVDELKKAYFTK